MDQKRRRGAALVAAVLLALLLVDGLRWRTAPGGWQVRLETSTFRLSISTGAPTVRDRSLLSDIGQSLVRRAAAR
jgi:hypothetical protein